MSVHNRERLQNIYSKKLLAAKSQFAMLQKASTCSGREVSSSKWNRRVPKRPAHAGVSAPQSRDFPHCLQFFNARQCFQKRRLCIRIFGCPCCRQHIKRDRLRQYIGGAFKTNQRRVPSRRRIDVAGIAQCVGNCLVDIRLIRNDQNFSHAGFHMMGNGAMNSPVAR